VNADDFGYSPGINRGILAAHERGIVTSTSVMVRWPAAAEAAAAAGDHPRLGLGLHVDLGEWVFRDGDWVPLYTVLADADLQSPAAVEAEVGRQVDAFRRLTGRGPTHLDSHQHAHRSEPLRSVLIAAGARLGVPVRHEDPRVRYCGEFYGQAIRGEPYPQGITPESLAGILSAVPPGVTELACHPGLGLDHASPYGPERQAEVEALCHPLVWAAANAAKVRFISFRELAADGVPKGDIHVPKGDIQVWRR
jgi:predicted glycoside hydrolase/deacetylase ChbG (UPF0249 family)